MPPPPPDELRRAFGHLPTGVTVVTAQSADGPLGATANAVSSLSLDPPLVLACLDLGSRTLAGARSEGRFGISVLGAGQEEVARAFATKDPHPLKWEGITPNELAGVPVVEGGPLRIACRLREVHPGGDHEILVGEVLAVDASGGDPLVFWGGRYLPLRT